MIKVSDATETILKKSEIALIALQKGWLNLSAFASTIHKEVESMTQKTVQKGTIIIALSRFQQKNKTKAPFFPNVVIENIQIKTALNEIVFENNSESKQNLSKFLKNVKDDNAGFLTTTFGINEITIISDEKRKVELEKKFSQWKPLKVISHLASITLRISPKHLEIPNTIFSIIHPLALRKENIIEIVSTYSEITLIIEESKLMNVLQILQNLKY